MGGFLLSIIWYEKLHKNVYHVLMNFVKFANRQEKWKVLYYRHGDGTTKNRTPCVVKQARWGALRESEYHKILVKRGKHYENHPEKEHD